MINLRQLKIAERFLSIWIQKEESLIKQLKIAKVSSAIDNIIGGKAPVGILVKNIQNKYEGNELKVNSEIEKLWDLEIEYSGALLSYGDIVSLSPDEVALIDFCIEE